MNTYSIVRIGDDYIVQAERKSILKIASRRRAAQLVARAAVLLNAESAASDAPRVPGAAQSDVSAHEAP